MRVSLGVSHDHALDLFQNFPIQLTQSTFFLPLLNVFKHLEQLLIVILVHPSRADHLRVGLKRRALISLGRTLACPSSFLVTRHRHIRLTQGVKVRGLLKPISHNSLLAEANLVR